MIRCPVVQTDAGAVRGMHGGFALGAPRGAYGTRSGAHRREAAPPSRHGVIRAGVDRLRHRAGHGHGHTDHRPVRAGRGCGSDDASLHGLTEPCLPGPERPDPRGSDLGDGRGDRLHLWPGSRRPAHDGQLAADLLRQRPCRAAGPLPDFPVDLHSKAFGTG